MIKKILLLTAIVLTAPVWSADTPAGGQSVSPTPEQVIEQFRLDLQAKRSDLMAQNLSLRPDQAAKFWPLYETFDKEQNEVMGAQLKATQAYADSGRNLTDADALKYVNTLLERDAKMHDLRVKWLAKFQTVVPAKVAARAIQIDRRLGLTTQIAISSQVPLIQ